MRRDLRGFSGHGYDKGRPKWLQATWFAVMNLFFIKWWLPRRIRPVLLRCFGAEVGDRVFIRHGVRILWPWKLKLGHDVWLGEGVWLLNLEPISIGSSTCISQEAFLIAGSHRRDSPTFEYDNGAIDVGRGVWIAARAMVLRGVTVGDGATVGATAVVRRDVPEHATVSA